MAVTVRAGSGTTGEAAAFEHVDAILIERETSYLPLIAARLKRANVSAAWHTITDTPQRDEESA